MDPTVAMLVAMMQQQDARHQEQLTHQEARQGEQLAAQQDQLQASGIVKTPDIV